MVPQLTQSTRPAAGATSTLQTTCVLAHGLGSGLGFFFPNLAYLASRFDRVVAFDWLGFAGSDRPEWDATASAQDATNFFTDSFTLFCDEMEIDRFTFIAHSMGGLLASEFALVCSRQTLDALILISPAGIPPRPEPQDVLDGSDLSGGLRLVKAAWEHNLTPGGFFVPLDQRVQNTARACYLAVSRPPIGAMMSFSSSWLTIFTTAALSLALESMP